MDRHSSDESSYSIDSLDEEFKRKLSIKDGESNTNVDTILVPFYDKDVLIKVTKHQTHVKKHENTNKFDKYSEKQNQHNSQRSFLMNKNRKNSKHSSYLEMFRKQFSFNYKDLKTINYEIRSLSPEVGDTERESISEVIDNLATEFFNTESYNEIYYEKLINEGYEQCLDNSLEELRIVDKIRSKSPNELADNNFRSVSEVSQPRRRLRRVTVEPVQNVKLGGLGADVEKIKPNLERAKSLQRYSERVRMANRVKIYKKSIETDNEKKNEKQALARYTDQSYSAKGSNRNQVNRQNSTFLVNKNVLDETSKLRSTVNSYKSKSANIQRIKERTIENVQHLKSASKKHDTFIPKQEVKNSLYVENNKTKVNREGKLKSAVRSKKEDKTLSNSKDIPPVHISFMVNIGGARASSALKTLEEKHQMYQDQIRSFNVHNNI